MIVVPFTSPRHLPLRDFVVGEVDVLVGYVVEIA